MASTNKTSILKLNQYVSADKPTMDDYNYDMARTENLAIGWIPNTVVLTYFSGDSITTPISSTVNRTVYSYVLSTSVSLVGKINIGWKIKFTNGGVVKMGFVMALTATNITVFCGTDYPVAATTITNVYFSSIKNPLDFPLNPDKWTVLAKMFLTIPKASPIALTWYQLAYHAMYIPVGLWKVDYKIAIRAQTSGATSGNYPSAYATLSLNGTSETDDEFTDLMWGNTSCSECSTLRGYKSIAISAKQVVYILTKCDDSTTTALTAMSGSNYAYIRAVCAYL